MHLISLRCFRSTGTQSVVCTIASWRRSPGPGGGRRWPANCLSKASGSSVNLNSLGGLAVCGALLSGSLVFAQSQPSITEYVMPNPGGEPGGIITGSDGALWFQGGGRITTDGIFTEYPCSERSSPMSRNRSRFSTASASRSSFISITSRCDPQTIRASGV
jgi:hypothetical protein